MKEDKENIVKKKEVPKFTWIVLLVIGCIDLFRGIMHTIFIDEALALFAHFDPTNGDLMLQMNAFGISNLITGALCIMIALKARHLADLALIYIPFAYSIGIIAIKMNNIVATSDFLGQFGMMAYIGICIGTFIATKMKIYFDNMK